MIPDEQIRERCREVLRDFTEAEHAKRELDVLESLYREAMAAGLEMAAEHSAYGSSVAHLHITEWCRQEAVRVKEGE